MFQQLVFKRGNAVGDNHPLPVIAEVTLSLTCRLPSSIALIVDEPGKDFVFFANVQSRAFFSFDDVYFRDRCCLAEFVAFCSKQTCSNKECCSC